VSLCLKQEHQSEKVLIQRKNRICFSDHIGRYLYQDFLELDFFFPLLVVKISIKTKALISFKRDLLTKNKIEIMDIYKL